MKGVFIKYLEELSEEFKFEANNVQSNTDDNIFLNDLYADRKIEKKILEILNSDIKFLLIIGEAGYGKTSLLWHLGEILQEKIFTYFIKSSELLKNKNLGDEILKLIQCGSEKKYVFFLDTLDLLLHNDDDVKFIIKLIKNLTEKNITVIATCRPLEAKKVHKDKIDCEKISLTEFDDDEFAVAVEKYASHYAKRSPNRSVEERKQSLINAVARGLPVEKICRNPLTLRMLFEIYYPHEVSHEINVFLLYQEYWKRRVESDCRVGEQNIDNKKQDDEQQKNLNSSTEAIALIMFAEGTPELEENLVEKNIEKLGGRKEDIDILKKRGILHVSDKNCSFFHQTFFEHSAARGLLTKLKEKSIYILETELTENSDDLFRMPVLEQVLLLAEENLTDICVRNLANESLKNLLFSDDILISISGIYVYGLRKKIHPDLSIEIRNLLKKKSSKKEEYIFCFELMKTAQIRLENRLEDLFGELSIIWEYGEWRLKETVLNTLEKLAARKPDKVFSFIKCNQIINYISDFLKGTSEEKSIAGTAISLLLRIFSVLNKFGDEPIKIELLKIYKITFKYCGADDLPARVLFFLSENIENINKDDLDDVLNCNISNLNCKKTGNWNIAIGNLLAKHWDEAELQLNNVIAKIKGLPEFFMLGGFNALALLIARSNSDQINYIFRLFLLETDDKFIYAWRITWERLLSKKIEILDKNIINELYECIVRTFSDYGSKNNPAIAKHSLVLQDALINAKLNKSELHKLLSNSNINDLSLWTSSDYFGRLLIDAFISELPVTKTIIEKYLKNEIHIDKTLSNIMNSLLADRVEYCEIALEAFIKILLIEKDHVRLYRLLNSFSSPFSVSNYIDDIKSLYINLFQSRSTKERSDGYRIWIWLLKNKLINRPTIDDLNKFLTIEKDRNCLSVVVQSIEFVDNFYNNEEKLFRLVTPLINPNTHIELRKNSLIALIKCFKENRSHINEKNIFQLKNILIQLPIIIEAIYETGYIIETLASHDGFLASDFFLNLMTVINSQTLGNKALKLLDHRWRKPVQILFKSLPFQRQEYFLNEVKNLNSQMIRLVINSVYDINDQTNLILINWLSTEIDDEVKNLIRNKNYYHARHRGDKEWLELYNLLIGNDSENRV